MTTTTTWRRPTATQIAGLRAVADGRTSTLATVQRLIDRGWVRDDNGYPALTSDGRRVLDDGEAIAKVAQIAARDLPNVELMKRMNGRAWLGWQVICREGCDRWVCGTRNCVWATNDHTAWDKWGAEAAYARHVLHHHDQTETPCTLGLRAGEAGPDGLAHWHTTGCTGPETDGPSIYVGSYAGSDPWSDARDNPKAW